jgi:hypothetical protein
MSRGLKLTFLFFLLCSLSLAEQPTLPSQDSVENRLKLLSTIQYDFPSLFATERSYDPDLVQYFAKQDILLRQLNEQSNYGELSKERSRPFSFRIKEGKSDLHLLEVPPHVGILRGHAGDDCATEYSFGYPWSPMERVFLVFGNNNLKGYVSGTKLLDVDEAKKQDSFYVHTITGPEISGREAVTIAKALVKSPKALNVSRVIFPPEENRDGNINYDEIKEALNEVMDESQNHKIKYLDEQVRSVIDRNVQTWNYDSHRKNTNSVRLSENEELDDVTVKAEKISFRSPTLRGVTQGSLLRMAAELAVTGNEALVETTLKYIKNGAEKMERLQEALQNPERLEAKPFLKAARAALEKEGISADVEFLASRHHLLAQGLRNSKDKATRELAQDKCRDGFVKVASSLK